MAVAGLTVPRSLWTSGAPNGDVEAPEECHICARMAVGRVETVKEALTGLPRYGIVDSGKWNTGFGAIRNGFRRSRGKDREVPSLQYAALTQIEVAHSGVSCRCVVLGWTEENAASGKHRQRRVNMARAEGEDPEGDVRRRIIPQSPPPLPRFVVACWY